MPNRILRDWTDSFSVNELDAQAERFFVRLIMKADDFGRFHADTRLLKANLFPLLSEIRDTDISRWIAACEKAGLLRCYVDDRSRSYLEIVNFRQRTRQSESKFPSPKDQSQASDGQATVKRQSSDSQARTKTETYSETLSETASGDDSQPSPKNLSDAIAEAMGLKFIPEGKPGEKLRTIAEEFRVAGIKPEDVTEFVKDWYARKVNSGWSNAVLLPDYLATDCPGWVNAKRMRANGKVAQAAPSPSYKCPKCKDRFAYVENGQTVKCDCWQKEAA